MSRGFNKARTGNERILMLRTITPKEGTPVAVIDRKNSYGKKSTINGVCVYIKGQSLTGSDGDKSPYNERAAYLVDKMLNLKLVPTTVLRLVDGKLVSAQRWVNGKPPKYEDNPPLLRLFDYLIHNTDRHGGNWLIEGGKVWAIDNAYSFYDSNYNRYGDEVAHNLSKVDKAKLRKRLQLVLTEPQKIHKQLDGLIGNDETDALISRMERIMNKIGDRQ
jgi:hypothetical protein